MAKYSNPHILRWACLGIFLANLTRRVYDRDITIFQAVNGQYIEAAVSMFVSAYMHNLFYSNASQPVSSPFFSFSEVHSFYTSGRVKALGHTFVHASLVVFALVYISISEHALC